MATKVCVAEIMIMPGGEALINRVHRGWKTYYPTPASARRLDNILAQCPIMMNDRFLYRI